MNCFISKLLLLDVDMKLSRPLIDLVTSPHALHRLQAKKSLRSQNDCGRVGGSITFFIARSPKLGAFLYINCGVRGSAVFNFLSMSRICQCLKIDSSSFVLGMKPRDKASLFVILQIRGDHCVLFL